MNLILGLSALIAALVTAYRYRAARQAERTRPGASPATAIPVNDYGQIDDAIATQRCTCGGHFAALGEGPVAGGAPLRFARLECRDCGRESTTYFHLGSMQSIRIH